MSVRKGILYNNLKSVKQATMGNNNNPQMITLRLNKIIQVYKKGV